MRAIFRKIHGLLVRETSGGKLIPHIDGLRFFAVMSVFLFHLNVYITEKVTRPAMAGHDEALQANPVWRTLSSGFFGVQIFFAISGFILGLPFADAWLSRKPRPALGRYFLRRVMRLEPPYIICLCVLAALIVLFKRDAGVSVSENVVAVSKHLGASLLYIHYFIFGIPSTINGVAWSLEVEVQFYILAPLLACVFAIGNKWVRRAILGMAILAFAFGQRYALTGGEHGHTLLHELHYFLCGFLIVDFYLVDWVKAGPASAKQSALWNIAGLAAWVGMVVILGWWTPLFPNKYLAGLYPLHERLPHVPLVIALFIAFAAAFRGRFWLRLLSHPFLYIIGGMCYTIYLWHFLIISMVGRVALRFMHGENHMVNVLIGLVVILPPALVLSAILFVLFEKPFMRRDWFERIVTKLRLRKTGVL